MVEEGRATTHTDLVVPSKEKIGGGSQSDTQRFGNERSWSLWFATLPLWFFTDTWRRPDSFYEKIKSNRTLGLHSLCLLGRYADIRVKEPTLESLCRGKKQYVPPKYMTIATAIEQLLEVEHARRQFAYCEDTACVGLARLGSEDQLVVAGSMKRVTEG